MAAISPRFGNLAHLSLLIHNVEFHQFSSHFLCIHDDKIRKILSVRSELAHLALNRHREGKIAIGIKARTRWERNSLQLRLEEVSIRTYQHQSHNATLSMETE